MGKLNMYENNRKTTVSFLIYIYIYIWKRVYCGIAYLHVRDIYFLRKIFCKRGSVHGPTICIQAERCQEAYPHAHDKNKKLHDVRLSMEGRKNLIVEMKRCRNPTLCKPCRLSYPSDGGWEKVAGHLAAFVDKQKPEAGGRQN